MAFPFKSKQFGGETGATRDKLNACAGRDSAHFVQGNFGDHIAVVQDALIQLNADNFLEGADVGTFQSEVAGAFYGNVTAKVVQSYKDKHKPKAILQPWQTTADNVVGKGTISALDDDMAILEGIKPDPPTIPTDIYIFFSGVQDGPPAGEELDDTAVGHGFLMRSEMKNEAAGRPKGKFLAIGGGLQQAQEDAGTSLALKFIRDNMSTPAGKHIVYGFSAGGTNAVHLSALIDAVNKGRSESAFKIRIDMLVTIDASVRNTSSVAKASVVGGCVRRFANYSQTESRPQGDGVGGGPLFAGSDSDGESPSIITNHRVTDKEMGRPLPGAAHRKIEEVTLGKALAHFKQAFVAPT